MKLLDIPLTDIQAVRILNAELTAKEALKILSKKDVRTLNKMVAAGTISPSYVGNNGIKRYKIKDLIFV